MDPQRTPETNLLTQDPAGQKIKTRKLARTAGEHDLL